MIENGQSDNRTRPTAINKLSPTGRSSAVSPEGGIHLCRRRGQPPCCWQRAGHRLGRGYAGEKSRERNKRE